MYGKEDFFFRDFGLYIDPFICIAFILFRVVFVENGEAVIVTIDSVICIKDVCFLYMNCIYSHF